MRLVISCVYFDKGESTVLDIIIKNAIIIDGPGAPAYDGSVGIDGD